MSKPSTHIITRVGDLIGLSPNAVDNAEKIFEMAYITNQSVQLVRMHSNTRMKLDSNAGLKSSFRALDIATEKVFKGEPGQKRFKHCIEIFDKDVALHKINLPGSITEKELESMHEVFQHMKSELQFARNGLYSEPGASAVGGGQLWEGIVESGKKLGYDAPPGNNPAQFIRG